LAAASPHIVVVMVESRQSRWNGQHTLLVTDYALRVEERLRGEAPDRFSITVPGGTLGRFSDETCVTVHLEPGSRYLLFLGRLDEPSLLPVTGAWQGMFRELPDHLAAMGRTGSRCPSKVGRSASPTWSPPSGRWPPRPMRRLRPRRRLRSCRPRSGT